MLAGKKMALISLSEEVSVHLGELGHYPGKEWL